MEDSSYRGTAAPGGPTSDEGTSLILLDVDHFKRINDEYGHPAGDQVLVELAELIVRGTRPVDVVCRLGGDEIAVLLPACSRDVAAHRAESLLAEVRAHRFTIDETTRDELSVSISVGLAHAPSDAFDLRTLYTAADTALYQAKRTGRGQVVATERPPLPVGA